jgi:hypothetical protein
VADRPADVWEPLLMVADLAGGGWPHRARRACTEFVEGTRDDTQTIGTRLLADLKAVWPLAGGSGTGGTSGTVLASTVPHVPPVPHIGTEDLLRRLHALDESPWGDWYGHQLTARDLAKLLRPYGVKSAKVRIGELSVRGYRAADLHDAWKRYGVSATSATSETPLASTVADVAPVAHTPAAGCPLHQSRFGPHPHCPDCQGSAT